jgi:ankyrin repeat protein
MVMVSGWIGRGLAAGLAALATLGTMTGAWCFSAGLQAAPSPSSAPVAEAAMSRDKETLRRLLQQGVDVNTAQGDGMTALHWTARNGDAELAGMLLYAGANLRATTRLGGYMPLHLASQAGHVPIIDALVKAGASVSTVTSTGATALMLAASSGSADAVKVLLDRGADLNAKESAHGETALMFAAALDRADVVGVLMQRGADTSLTTKVVDLTTVIAPEESLQDAIRQAQAAKSAEATAKPEANVGAGRGTTAPTPGEKRPPEIAGVTRAYRFNELIGKQGGLSALHLAARQGALRTVRTLVEGGADVNQISLADRTTPLVVATINGQFDIAKYLLDKGADPNLASEAGATALYSTINVQWAPRAFYPQPRAHLQQQISYIDLMKALLDTGADPNARVKRKIWYTQYNFELLRVDEAGATPFWRAAYASDIDAMALLVAHGADANIPTMKGAGRGRRDDGTRAAEIPAGLPAMPAGGPGIPPVVAAAGAGYGEGFAGNAHRYAPGGMLAAVTYLIEELHADVNAGDHEGNTTVHHAAARGDNEMILYLVSKGADVKRVNRAGQTTVDMANGPVQRTQPFPETIKLLEGLGAKNNHKCVSC